MVLDPQELEYDEFVLAEWEEAFLDTIDLTPLIDTKDGEVVYLSALVEEIKSKYNDQYEELFPRAAYPLCSVLCKTEMLKYLIKKYDIDFWTVNDYVIE